MEKEEKIKRLESETDNHKLAALCETMADTFSLFLGAYSENAFNYV